jgi:cyclophilin family peptidyl-prolyl cis-trans isomerase
LLLSTKLGIFIYVNKTAIVITVLVVLGVGGLIYATRPPSSETSVGNNTGGLTPIPSQTTQDQTQQPTQPPMKPIPTEQFISATTATITTPKGNIVLQLYPQDAPKTVQNFATLAKTGYYNGLTFHRVEPGFVIQGGDPNGNGTGGYSIYGAKFEDELNPSTQSYKDGYQEGVLAMANAGPNTNGSQFFIMLADNQSLPKNYTIFGKVTSGMDVVKQIQVGDKMTSVTAQ